MPTSSVRLACLASLALAGLTSCASNPVTGRPDLVFSSEKGEVEKAKEVHPMLLQQFGGVYDDLLPERPQVDDQTACAL